MHNCNQNCVLRHGGLYNYAYKIVSKLSLRTYFGWENAIRSKQIDALLHTLNSLLRWKRHNPIKQLSTSFSGLLRTIYSCNKTTTTWIQISSQNWNGFFSNASHQILWSPLLIRRANHDLRNANSFLIKNKPFKRKKKRNWL